MTIIGDTVYTVGVGAGVYGNSVLPFNFSVDLNNKVYFFFKVLIEFNLHQVKMEFDLFITVSSSRPCTPGEQEAGLNLRGE